LLRSRRLAALKFRRQFPIGPYVVDFVCLRLRLVVELDGPFHDPEHDTVRDAWLVAQGFTILRFPNSQLVSPDEVLGRILEAAEEPPAKRQV
jgi:very-short-patch-repair endonuclease